MTRPWPEQVVDAAISGEPARLPGDRLDDLLAWLLDRDQPGTRLLSEQFETQGVDREQAVQLSLALLDELLGHGEDEPLACLGFTAQPEKETLRRRYRRLQQVFHPDRQFGGEDWATQRSESINSAYRKIKSGKVAGAEPVVASAPAKTSAAADVAGGNNYGYPRRRFADRLRARLGSSSKVQRAVVSSLILVSVTGLALTYLAYRSDTHTSAGARYSPPALVGDGSVASPPPLASLDNPEAQTEPDSTPPSTPNRSRADVERVAGIAWARAAPGEPAPVQRWRERGAVEPPDAALLVTEFALRPPIPGAAKDRAGPLMHVEGRQARSQALRSGVAIDEPAGREALDSGRGPDPQLAERAGFEDESRSVESAGETEDHEQTPAADRTDGDTTASEQVAAAVAGEEPEPGPVAQPASETPASDSQATGTLTRQTRKAGTPEPDAGSPAEQSAAEATEESVAVAAVDDQGAAPATEEPGPGAAESPAAGSPAASATDAPDALAANRVTSATVAPDADGGDNTDVAPGSGAAAGPAVNGNASGPSAADPCRGYRSFLRRYEDAYDRGHLERLLDLYAADARENQLEGLSAITETYRQFFGDTRSRRITIAVADVEALEDECRLHGDYRVTYRTGRERRRQSAGTIVLHLVDADAGFRITEIRY